MPAPPHDASGHTWHHPDAMLFGIIKHGLIPGKYGPPDYQRDMLAFGDMLSDEEIWAVLAYIKSSWPQGHPQGAAQSDVGAEPALRRFPRSMRLVSRPHEAIHIG